MALIRGYIENKYHYCGICGDRTPLAQMRYQRGVLVCVQKCLDTGVFPSVGDRDREIARLLGTYTDSKELQPDRMLTESSIQQEDDVSFKI
jgi:hypothetical protein